MSDDGFDDDDSIHLLVCDFHSRVEDSLLVDIYVRGKISKEYAKSLALDVLDSEDFRIKKGKTHLIRMVKFAGSGKFTPGTTINRHVDLVLMDSDLDNMEYKPSEVSESLMKSEKYNCSEKTKKLIKLLLMKNVYDVRLDIEEVKNLNSDGEDDEHDINPQKMIKDNFIKVLADQMSVTVNTGSNSSEDLSKEVESLISIGYLTRDEFSVIDDQVILNTPFGFAFGDYIKFRDLWFWDDFSGWESRLTRIPSRNVGKKFDLFNWPGGKLLIKAMEY
jgi:hypothetical protein